MTISEMLTRNARMYPEDSALIEIKPSEKTRTEITWQKFDEKANRIANALIDRGVGKGDKIIHLMMNSINWLEAYLVSSEPGHGQFHLASGSPVATSSTVLILLKPG